MRPEALEIEGFTAFRDKTRIDFADADLFAFTGPTGAGKSSLIDAMVFALYGHVPRLGERAVVPVISQGRQEARIRLDFALGERRYTAVRVVRRGTRGTAVRGEARLQQGEEVIAASVREVDAEIRGLIGLNFQQFTTCAVLPQGEFARFLHAQPANRQELLTQLLGFAVYKAMRQLANQRGEAGRSRMEVWERQLEGLEDVDKKAEKAKARRVTSLNALQKETAKTMAEIADLEGQIEAVAPKRADLEARLEALRAIRMPDDVKELASELHAAKKAVDTAEQERNEANAEFGAAEAGRTALGDKGDLVEKRFRHRERAKVERGLLAANEQTKRAERLNAGHQTALAAAEQEATAAREALEAARRMHAAHELRSHLVAGESCPVCGQSVSEPVTGEKPPELAVLEAGDRKAKAHLDAVKKKSEESAQELAVAANEESGRRTTFEELSRMLAGALSLAEIEETLREIEAADGKRQQAEKRRERATQLLLAARDDRQAVDDRVTAAWTAYHSARNSVSVLTPPSPDSNAVTDSWLELQAWTTKTMPELAEKDQGLREEGESLEVEANARRDKLIARFEEHGVEFGDDPTKNLVDSMTQAGVALADIRKKREEKKRLRRELKQTEAGVVVAETLAQHLRTAGFERWLMHEGFGRLAASASKLLLELSNGQYAFRHNDQLEFEVIDHANAGEARSARTLSGGETFLASLSLALALGEEVSELATEGTARLESIFLDEGFGTLDPDTLDVVATAIEELGARGRMVGVVTHIAALAERIPVQFKVAKVSGTASVQRIDT